MLYALLSVIALPFLWSELGKRTRAYFVQMMTAMNESEELGSTRREGKIRGTVVVAGGSMAGLFAARMCADLVERVIIVEPELWVGGEHGMRPKYDSEGNSIAYDDPTPKRSRVFQYGLLHGSQLCSTPVLRKLFPDIEKEGKRFDVHFLPLHSPVAVNGVFTESPYEYFPHTGLPRLIACSRDTFERFLRYLTRKTCPNIRWISGSVTGFVRSKDDNNRIGEVIIKISEPGGDTEVRERSTLLVDCTGPVAAGLGWLKDCSPSLTSAATKPTDLTLKTCIQSHDPKMRYRNFYWHISPEIRYKLPLMYEYDETHAVYLSIPDPSVENRTVVIAKLDGHIAGAIFGGWGVAAEDSPTTLNEIFAWLRSLRAAKPVPQFVFDFLTMVNEAAGYGPDDKIPSEPYRPPPTKYVRYHRVPDLPSNFVAVGDSVSQMNPVFAQGLSKAIIGAATLHNRLLHTRVQRVTPDSSYDLLPPTFGHEFFVAQAPKIEGVLEGTKSFDYSFPTTIPAEGESLSDGAFMRNYMAKASELSATDRELNYIFFMIRNFLAPVTDMFAPHTALRVFWFWLTTLGS